MIALLDGFIKSERANNIFYGDVFRINGEGCLVFGTGKTKAAEIASDDLASNTIALDMSCITVGNKGRIYGHFELPIRLEEQPDPVFERIEIKYFLKMLDERETLRLYGANEGFENHITIVEISYESFLSETAFNIAYADFWSDMEEMPKVESSPSKRMKNFRKITRDSGVRCFLVPWRDNVEDKGKMIKRNLKLVEKVNI